MITLVLVLRHSFENCSVRARNTVNIPKISARCIFTQCPFQVGLFAGMALYGVGGGGGGGGGASYFRMLISDFTVRNVLLHTSIPHGKFSTQR